MWDLWEEASGRIVRATQSLLFPSTLNIRLVMFRKNYIDTRFAIKHVIYCEVMTAEAKVLSK